MRRQSGQASILIALIFQVLFILFAMVINVGLIVSDKVNLQNSVDIAAYYGAMKQAEVLTAMSQVNFQIRQAWKLMNWRLWALSNVSRNPDFFSGNLNPPDEDVVFPDEFPGPLVCISNSMWFDNTQNKRDDQNICKKGDLKPPSFEPLKANPIVDIVTGGASSAAAAISRQFVNRYNNDCNSFGGTNFQMAYLIGKSYKQAVANRRFAMWRLQQLLVDPPLRADNRDGADLNGESIGLAAKKVYEKNLTVANRTAGQQSFQFYNSLAGRPFIVPVEVQAFIAYQDFSRSGCNGIPRQIVDRPTQSTGLYDELTRNGIINDFFLQYDYNGSPRNRTAADFFNERERSQFVKASLVGFEKNPWIVAYVHISAETRPKMLFAPFAGPVTLRAEAYAMPFGSRMGPWYYDRWPAGAEQSSSAGKKVDELLPARLDRPDRTLGLKGNQPNFSRFVGDALGMRSRLTQSVGIISIFSEDQGQKVRFADDDYNNVRETGTSREDPLVFSNDSRVRPRAAEVAAIAPNLFDAAYFSITEDFLKDVAKRFSLNLFSGICDGKCNDMGFNPRIAGDFDVKRAIEGRTATRNAYWLITNPDHLLTGWAQEDVDRYLPAGDPTKIGIPGSPATGDFGGRASYSVKIVSKKFLNNSSLPFGGGPASNPVRGPILNKIAPLNQ